MAFNTYKTYILPVENNKTSNCVLSWEVLSSVQFGQIIYQPWPHERFTQTGQLLLLLVVTYLQKQFFFADCTTAEITSDVHNLGTLIIIISCVMLWLAGLRRACYKICVEAINNIPAKWEFIVSYFLTSAVETIY